MINGNDVKVAMATAAGLLNWVADIDIFLQLCISIASFVYIILKIRELIAKGDK